MCVDHTNALVAVTRLNCVAVMMNVVPMDRHERRPSRSLVVGASIETTSSAVGVTDTARTRCAIIDVQGRRDLDYVTVCGFPLIPGSGRYVG